MTEENERNDGTDLGVSRRDVMKAASGAIVAGGVTSATAGVAAAQEKFHCFNPNQCDIAVKSDASSTIPSGVSFSSSGSQGTVTINTSTNPDLAGYQATLYIKGGGGSGPSACGQGVSDTTRCNQTTTITASTAQGDFSHAELCLTANPQVNFTDDCPSVNVTTNVCSASYTVTYDQSSGCGPTSGTITGGSGTINVGSCSGTITVTALGQTFTHTFDCTTGGGGGGGGNCPSGTKIEISFGNNNARVVEGGDFVTVSGNNQEAEICNLTSSALNFTVKGADCIASFLVPANSCQTLTTQVFGSCTNQGGNTPALSNATVTCP